MERRARRSCTRRFENDGSPPKKDAMVERHLTDRDESRLENRTVKKVMSEAPYSSVCSRRARSHDEEYWLTDLLQTNETLRNGRWLFTLFSFELHRNNVRALRREPVSPPAATKVRASGRRRSNRRPPTVRVK